MAVQPSQVGIVDRNENHRQRLRQRVVPFLYATALVTAVLLWLIPIRAPLWLDETITYVQIDAGFVNIFSRQGWPGIPVYQIIFWLFTKLLGTSEVALRTPCVLGMLGAAYLLYRASRKLFDPSVAIIAAILFCVNPIVIFAAIDMRPHVFAVLVVNAAIYALVLLRESRSWWLAAWFGAMGAIVIWCHFLYATIIPALLVGFLIVKLGGRNRDSEDKQTILRQLGAAVAGFGAAFLPIIPLTLYMFRTPSEHSFDQRPELADLLGTLAPGWSLPVLALTAFVALIIAGLRINKGQPTQEGIDGWRIWLCQVLTLVPLLILFLVSIATPIHIFVVRYRLVAVPGIALCWAVLVSGFKPRALQPFFCVAVVALTTYQYFRSPSARQHGYTWKYALQATEKKASIDQAPVLICSDQVESNYWPLPSREKTAESVLFAPLAYYKLTVPVVPLPRALNSEAVKIGTSFLQEASRQRQRFLAVAFIPSYPTIGWIARQASKTHTAHQIGVFDGVIVVEFIPRGSAD